ncbi:MAG: GIY-YIG nuclease family protein [Solirubrobacteraceae bacterium]|nr:GIY-YIG nuclease family protein [Solirubrobacteraceae bacterium]
MTSRTYGVYVIELDRGPGAVYVGSTGKSFDERMAQHNEGGPKAAQVFRRRGARGLRLRDDLHGHLPRFDDRDVAERAERRLANQLRHRGFDVTAGI